MEVLFIITKKQLVFLLVVCIAGIFLITSVSATDLNETIVSDVHDGVIGAEEVADTQDDLTGSDDNVSDIVTASGNDLNDNKDEDSEKLGVNFDDDEEITSQDSSNLNEEPILKLGNTISVTTKTFSAIKSAIDNAEDGDTILLSGYYTNDLTDFITFRKELNFVGINDATLDAKQSGGIFQIRNSATMTNIIFQNAKSTYNGALIISNPCTLINCTFKNNLATESSRSYGGAIYASSGATISCINCTFIGNSAHNGGAINNKKGNIINCTFINNSGDSGGAVLCEDSNTFNNCTFINNNAGTGGAIEIFHGELNINNCTFKSNSANVGGGIYSEEKATIFNSTLIKNSANIGGAIYSEKEVTLFDSTLINNTAETANAIGAEEVSIIVNCTLVNNFDLKGWRYEPKVTDSTFVNESGVKSKSVLKIDGLVFNLGDEGILTSRLYGDNGPIANKLLTFSINNADYEVTTNEAGYANLNITGNLLELGEYKVIVSFAGDAVYNPVSGVSMVNVKYYKTFLNVNNLSLVFGSEGLLKANLSNINGSLSAKNIIFTVNGNDYSASTDYEGIATFNFTQYLSDVGYYVIDVKFEGDESNAPCLANASVIIKYQPTITSNNFSVVKGDNVIIYAILSSDNGPLKSENIIFNVNGVNTTQQTSSSGLVTLNLKDDLTEVGEYDVGIIYEGNENNYPCSTSIKIRITEYSGFLYLNQVGKYYNDTHLVLTLINSRDNVAVPDASVRLVFSNGVIVNLTTDTNGVADYSVPFDPDTYNVTASVADPYVDVYDVEREVVVKVIRGEIEITQNGTEYNNSNLNIKLYNPDDYRDVFRNVNVVLELIDTGDSVNLITNDEGIAVYNIPFSVGTYHVLAHVTGKHVDFADVEKNDVVIDKADADVIFSNEIVFSYGKFGYTNITVIGGNVYKSNIEVIGQTAIIDLNENVVGITGLGVGSYILKVTVTPDSNHNSVSRTLNITVNKIASDVTFTDKVVFDFGSSGSTTLILDGCSVDEANISVINHLAKIELNGNEVTVSNLDAGNYTLQVITTPDEYHSSVTRTTSITVNKVNSSIGFSDLSVSDVVFEYGSFGITTLVLDGCSVDLNNISVIGHDEANIGLDGNKINISGLKVGEYYLQVISTPDANHFSVLRVAKIIVYKASSHVDFTNDVVFDYGSSGSTTLILDGCSVDLTNISVRGHKEAIIDLKGNEIIISNLTVGSYTLQVISTPDENHTSVVGTANIRVDKIDSSVSFDDVVFYYGDSGHVTLHCIGCSVKESDIEVEGHEAIIKLNVNEITISNLTVGTYTLKVVTTPDADYKSVTKTGKITVIRSNSSIKFNNINFKYGGSGSTELTLNGCSVEEKNIKVVGYDAKIKLNGNKVTVSGLNAGSYTLQVTTTPDSNHVSVTKSCSVIVNKVDANINFTKAISFNYGGSGSTKVYAIGGTLDLNKINVVGHTEASVFYINNEVTVSKLDAGTYKLSVTVIPDSNHNSVTKYIGITVKKQGSTTVKVKSEIKFGDPIVFYYGGSGSTTVSVFGGSVSTKTIKVDGHSKAKIKLVGKKITVSGLGVGSYTLRVKSIPYENYYSSVETLRITVKKIPVAIKASKVSVVYKKSKVWTIKLVNTKTKKGIANTVVKLKIFTGKKFTTKKVRTNSKGIAKFKISSKMSVGKHKVVLSMSKKGHTCKSLTSRITVKSIKLSFEVTSKYQNTGSMVSVWVKNKKTPANNIKVKMLVYTGSKITKKFTLITGNYKSYKGFVGYGTNALSVGKHKVVVKPLSKIYAGSGQTTMIIQKGANKYGTGYSLVSKGKLTLH